MLPRRHPHAMPSACAPMPDERPPDGRLVSERVTRDGHALRGCAARGPRSRSGVQPHATWRLKISTRSALSTALHVVRDDAQAASILPRSTVGCVCHAHRSALMRRKPVLAARGLDDERAASPRVGACPHPARAAVHRRRRQTIDRCRAGPTGALDLSTPRASSPKSTFLLT